MKTKALQYFSSDYLRSVKHLKAEQILAFLEDFRKLHGGVGERGAITSDRQKLPLRRSSRLDNPT